MILRARGEKGERATPAVIVQGALCAAMRDWLAIAQDGDPEGQHGVEEPCHEDESCHDDGAAQIPEV